MTITANAAGRISGTFMIPAGIPAGAKQVDILGKASRGSATFTGQGTLTTTTLQRVTTVTTWRYPVDPLAQTFTPARDVQIAGADLYFTACGGKVRVQIRETQTGFPTRTVLADTTVQQADITTGAWTRVLFDAPAYLSADAEYALVVLCDDATTALAVAELGKFDAAAQKWVTQQPYTVGVLLSSSNASTWSAHQDKDMTFRLLEAKYTASNAATDFGTVAVDAATDLLLLSASAQPTSQTSVQYDLALPGGEVVTVASGQPVRLASPATGPVGVKARLAGSPAASPVLLPGTQLVTGQVGMSADYYSRAIPATNATRVVVIYDAAIPSGASVTPEVRLDDGEWQPLTLNATTQQGNGIVEYRHSLNVSEVQLARLRITLTGTSAARPRVRNIRMLALL